MARLILACDIGGTNTRLALFREEESHRFRSLRRSTVASDEVVSVADAIRGFLGAEAAEVAAGALGVAGPVLDGEVKTTNLPWTLSERDLTSALRFPVRLLNDLEANAHGISELDSSDLAVLQVGRESSGPCVLIAAGTGMGQAIFLRRPDETIVLPTEGGHSDLAPMDERDFILLRALWNRHGHASVERILSGPGLFTIYELLAEGGHFGVPDPEVRERIRASEDPSAEISKAATSGRCGVCRQLVERFVEHYGAEAGNLALKALATGGVFVGGGIAPKLLSVLEAGHFLRGFLSKGRMRPLLERMPVTVILNDQTALLGAAAVARRM